MWTKKVGHNQMRKTMSTGHEINGNDPLNQMIDSVTHLTLLLGSLFCSSKHKSQAHLSDTSVWTFTWCCWLHRNVFCWTSLETRWPCIGSRSCINYKLFHMGILYDWVNYYLALASTLCVVLNYIYFDVLQSLLDRCFLWHNHNYRAGQKICL